MAVLQCGGLSIAKTDEEGAIFYVDGWDSALEDELLSYMSQHSVRRVRASCTTQRGDHEP